MDSADKRPWVFLLELTCSPGLGFSLASAYLESYALHARDLGHHYRFRRGLAYTGLGADGVAACIDDALDSTGEPAVLAFTIYFWNREATLREIRRLKKKWPTALVVVGGNDVVATGDPLIEATPEIDVICTGEGERTFADILSAFATSGRVGLAALPGATLTSNGALAMPGDGRIEDLNEIPSPFLTGVLSSKEISNSTMVVMETNRGCPFACAFCYWGGAINTRVRRFASSRLSEEIEFVVANMRTGGTLFLADANFGMHTQDLAFARTLVDTLARANKKILIFVNWAKNTTDRVVEAAELMFKGGLIGSVTLSAQSLSPAALEACQRQNIPFAQYERLQAAFAARGIPTYTELLLGLPPESAEEFRHGLNRVLDSGGHPVVYPLLLLNNTEFASPQMRKQWGLNVRRLPYQPKDLDAVVDTVTGHLNLSEENWLEQMDLVLVMGVFLHALAGATIRGACAIANCSQVEGLQRLLDALRAGDICWPHGAQALFNNYRAAALDAAQHDQSTIDSIIGPAAIPDHLHYQAIIHLTAAWVSAAPSNADILLGDVARAILQRAPTDDEAVALFRLQRPQLSALASLVTQTNSRESDRLADFKDMPVDALLLGIYHGAVRLHAASAPDGMHA